MRDSLVLMFWVFVFCCVMGASSCSIQSNTAEGEENMNDNVVFSEYKNKFQKHVKYLERKALDNPDFAMAKKEFGVEKWGEPLVSKLKNPVLYFPKEICFDLRKVTKPWYVVHQPLLDLNSSSSFSNNQALPSGITQRFILAGSMASLGLPFDDNVESNIIFNVGQHYLAVVVDGRVEMRDSKEKLSISGFNPNFEYYKTIIGKNSVWEPIDQPAYSYNGWSFQRYASDETLTAIDFKNRGFYQDKNWHAIDGERINYKGGYPEAPAIQGISPVGVGRYISKNDDFWVQFNLPSASTPRVAEVFQLIDEQIQSLIVPCKKED